MLSWALRKVVGSKNQRTIKKLWPLVRQINSLEEDLQKLPEESLREKTVAWQERFSVFHEPPFLGGYRLQGANSEELSLCIGVLRDRFAKLKEHVSIDDSMLAEGSDEAMREGINAAREEWEKHAPAFPDKEQAILEEILPEAYAVVKNAARRLCGQEIEVNGQPISWDMVHFDVQLIGGISLHRGSIAEMATGEGKTLVATLPVYLNALTGRGVHVITVNDYLALRDSEWMGGLYRYLGLTVGCIQNALPPHIRREQYGADITYGTNSEFGFDYLRDNGMASSREEQVQKGHYFAIIDEVDSVLIDEARTPLIISGPVTIDTHQYDTFRPLVDQLVKKQNLLCNRLSTEGNQAYDEGDMEKAGEAYFKVKLGQPRNRAFMRVMEDPEKRRLIEKTELSFYQDTQKAALFALKEELLYTMDEKSHDADLSEDGRTFLNPDDPEAFVLPDLATEFADIDNEEILDPTSRAQRKEALQEKMDSQAQRIHNITQLLKAYCLYEKDVHYVVEDNKVLIVDEGTGRKMPGRRWSDGLHQAVEAKEGVKIDKETQTLATITVQNYFRLYEKLAGMTGTAETDAAEFQDIYGLTVLTIPTNRPVQRIDGDDAIYKTVREKYNAVIALIRERHDKGQPILVGTASVGASELVGRLLKREGIPHEVLNAKNHLHEAEIVSRAGQRGAVTVSTNMAGRGTDIKLGQGIADIGGLLVVATERHESRRIDRQLRGRCARQGDPGESKFYISFEDDLMRNFGAAERMTKMMERFGLEDGQELEHPWLNKSVETAQKRVEQRNYTIRKRVLEFDDVMNKQREVVYGYRNEIIESEEPRVLIYEAIDEAVPERVFGFLGDGEVIGDFEPDYDGLMTWINVTFPLNLDLEESGYQGMDAEAVAEDLIGRIKSVYELKSQSEDPERLEGLERSIVLVAVDRLWQEHLYKMDGVREGVHLRSYGQKDPLVEYKNEAFSLFTELMGDIKQETLGNLFRTATSLEAFEQFLANLQGQQSATKTQGLPGMAPEPQPQQQQQPQQGGGSISMGSSGTSLSSSQMGQAEEERPKITLPQKREEPRVGRNDSCPCGSGKKYKQCCGRKA